MAREEKIRFEVKDNFQKQTYRNRCYIYGANGKQLLSIPILQDKKGVKVKSKEVKIDYSANWQVLHKRALDSAYLSSPFYEFYIDDLQVVFEKQFKYLLDLNLKTFEILQECLQLNLKVVKTTNYQKELEAKKDFRFLANAKKEQNFTLDKYVQVFDNKHGFIPNLSILDLLFNEGPNAENYLINQVYPKV